MMDDRVTAAEFRAMRVAIVVIGIIVAVMLAGCAETRERVVTRIQRVDVPVPVACPAPDVPPVPGPDIASPDTDILSAAQHVMRQVVRLRAAEQALRDAIAACDGPSD